jgi:hypothetical protein
MPGEQAKRVFFGHFFSFEVNKWIASLLVPVPSPFWM